MPVDETIDRLRTLDEYAEQQLVDAYWDALNAMNTRNRLTNELEPLLDEYADEHDIDRTGLGMEAGALGSRMRHYQHGHDTLADAVDAYYENVQSLKEDAPISARAAEIVVADVLPEFMDAVDVSDDYE